MARKSKNKVEAERLAAIEEASRVEAFVKRILDGAQFIDLADFAASTDEGAAKSPWGLTPGQVARLQALAYEVIVARDQTDAATRKAVMIAQKKRLMAKAIQQGDTRTANAISDAIANLQGLFPPNKAAKQDGPKRLEDMQRSRQDLMTVEEATRLAKERLEVQKNHRMVSGEAVTLHEPVKE
jgi:hypothetical protein